MFWGCNGLNSGVKLNNLNNVENADSLFYGCENFNQPIELNLPKCKNLSFMFAGCKKLNFKIELTNINNAKNSSSLFFNCKNLEFKNIESVINQLIIYFGDIIELEKKIEYQIPEKYKNKIKKKSFYVVNQI